jgi:hypothetical protein
MFEASSRYFNCPDAKITINIPQDQTNTSVNINTTANVVKREIVYKKRRFLPTNKNLTILQELVVKGQDRLDLIAASVLGDPEQFWRICDANDAMYPPDLTSQPGKIIRISSPW